MQQQGKCSLVVGKGWDGKVGKGASMVVGASHTGLCNTAVELERDSCWCRAW